MIYTFDFSSCFISEIGYSNCNVDFLSVECVDFFDFDCEEIRYAILTKNEDSDEDIWFIQSISKNKENTKKIASIVIFDKFIEFESIINWIENGTDLDIEYLK